LFKPELWNVNNLSINQRRTFNACEEINNINLSISLNGQGNNGIEVREINRRKTKAGKKIKVRLNILWQRFAKGKPDIPKFLIFKQVGQNIRKASYNTFWISTYLFFKLYLIKVIQNIFNIYNIYTYVFFINVVSDFFPFTKFPVLSYISIWYWYLNTFV
jgi:hypothetical protein